MVDKRECVHLTFVPQNSQDFGFTGHLYVLNDSTYAVQKCTMNLPKKDRSQLRQPHGYRATIRTTPQRKLGIVG